MNVPIELMALVCLLVGLNVFYAVLSYRNQQDDRAEKNRLIKALMAKNVFEYAQTEKSPDDVLKELGLENELALKAEVIEDKKSQREGPRGIAIT